MEGVNAAVQRCKFQTVTRLNYFLIYQLRSEEFGVLN